MKTEDKEVTYRIIQVMRIESEKNCYLILCIRFSIIKSH